MQAFWFRLFPFRSPLLWESLLISFPLATKMFQFARFALSTLYIQVAVFWVAPFGHFRLNACFQLPGTFVGNHVLLRLCVPRYPPSALIPLTFCLFPISLNHTCALSSFSYYLPFSLLLCSFHGSLLSHYSAFRFISSLSLMNLGADFNLG